MRPVGRALRHAANVGVAYGNVRGPKLWHACDGASDNRAYRVDAFDQHVAQERACSLSPLPEPHKDWRAHVLHADVGDRHTIDAAAVHGLDIDAADHAIHHGTVAVAVDDGVAEDNVFEGSARRGAHL